MPEVITDTSPIQYLYQTNLLGLLPTLYGQIILPQAVADELAQGQSQGVALPDPASLSWLTIRPLQESVKRSMDYLHFVQFFLLHFFQRLPTCVP
jgi:predicted nucleic acid-binding protein